MKRLRRKEPFGKAGLTVAILALVLAMVGGAYAAVGLNSKQKKEVTKIAKKYAGKPGAPGATGPAGAPGTNGTNGKDGTNGTNGTSATATSFTGVKGTCTVGGVEVKSASPTVNVCNGQTGFTETLPSGKTLQGDWGFATASSGIAFDGDSVSFNIPLETAPTVVYVKEGVATPEHCSGSVTSPGAEPGYLCVFANHEEGVNHLSVCADSSKNPFQDCVGNTKSADPYGFGVWALDESAGLLAVNGSWAVTAP